MERCAAPAAVAAAVVLSGAHPQHRESIVVALVTGASLAVLCHREVPTVDLTREIKVEPTDDVEQSKVGEAAAEQPPVEQHLERACTTRVAPVEAKPAAAGAGASAAGLDGGELPVSQSPPTAAVATDDTQDELALALERLMAARAELGLPAPAPAPAVAPALDWAAASAIAAPDFSSAQV